MSKFSGYLPTALSSFTGLDSASFVVICLFSLLILYYFSGHYFPQTCSPYSRYHSDKFCFVRVSGLSRAVVSLILLIALIFLCTRVLDTYIQFRGWQIQPSNRPTVCASVSCYADAIIRNSGGTWYRGSPRNTAITRKPTNQRISSQWTSCQDTDKSRH